MINYRGRLVSHVPRVLPPPCDQVTTSPMEHEEGEPEVKKQHVDSDSMPDASAPQPQSAAAAAVPQPRLPNIFAGVAGSDAASDLADMMQGVTEGAAGGATAVPVYWSDSDEDAPIPGHLGGTRYLAPPTARREPRIGKRIWSSRAEGTI